MHPFSSTKGLEILTKKKNIFIIGPYHYCYSVASLIEGLNKIDDVKVFSNSEHNYCSNVVNTLSVQNQVCKMADVVVLCHSAMEDKYRDIIHPLLLEVQYDIDVYLDGSDNYELENDPTKYKLYLKREMHPEIIQGHKNIEPFLFATEDRYFTDNKCEWKDKKDDLVCMMAVCERRHWRQDIIDALNNKFINNDKVFAGTFYGNQNQQNENVSTFEAWQQASDRMKFGYSVPGQGRDNTGYFDKLMAAKISVVAWGAASCRQTGRFYESLANRSMLLCMAIDPWITNHPFTDGKDIVLFNDTTELVEKADYYISHPDESEKIANAGYEHMLKYHTTKTRANQFLSLIKEYL